MRAKFYIYQQWITLVARLILGGLLLAAGGLKIGAAVAISGLLGAFTMLAFIIAIAQAWARGLSIDCGCFGGGGAIDPEDTKYLSEIIRDIGLLALGIYLYYFPKGKFGLDK